MSGTPGDPGTGPSRPVDLCDTPTLRDLKFKKTAHSALPQGGIAGGTAGEHIGMSHVWVGPKTGHIGPPRGLKTKCLTLRTIF